MTPEQREIKNQRDRERRAKMKAAGVKTLAELELAKGKPAKKPKAAPAPVKVAQPQKKPKALPDTDPVKQYQQPGEPLIVISFRGTKAQKQAFDALGGGAWVRDKIDRAA